MKKIIILLITSFVFVSCFQPEKNVTYKKRRVNDQYVVKVPTYMKKTDVLNDDASLQYMNSLKETYISVIEEAKDSFIQIFKDLGDYNDSLSVAENYKNIQLESFKDFVVGYKTSDEITVDYNGKPSFYTTVDGEVDDIGISYSFRFVEGKEVFIHACLLDIRPKKRKVQKHLQGDAGFFF